MTNALVAPTVDGPVSTWAGLSLAEDVQQVWSGVTGGGWVDASIGVASAGIDTVAFAVDPIGTLAQYGVGWLMEHVKPLSEALDWLAGDPAAISAQAQTWRNVGGALRTNADELIRAVRWDTTDWTGEAGDAYRGWSGNQQHAVTALATAADTMAEATDLAAGVINGVRMMVREAIATVVSRLIDYALEELFSLGFATPVVAAQAATLCATWANRIAHWLRSLVGSLHRLHVLIDKLTEALAAIKALFRRLGGADHNTAGPVLSRVKGRGAGPAQFFRLESVRSVADKYGIDLSGLVITLADKKHRGRCGCTHPDGSIVLYPTGFRSEEDLARTLVHEKFHHDELAAGAPFPYGDDVAEWEKRAWAHETQWWNNQPVRPEPRQR